MHLLLLWACLCYGISAVFNGRRCCISHQKCLFPGLDLFFFFFFITEVLHWEQRLAHGWAVPNINSSHECFRKDGIVLSHLKMTSQGKLFGTRWLSLSLQPSLGSVMCCPGLARHCSPLQGEQVHRMAGVVVGQSPAPSRTERTNFGMVSGMFRATPDASPGNELGISSTASICSASFVYILRIYL